MDFKIVTFTDHNMVDWVPACWIIGLDQCSYPNDRSDIVTKIKTDFDSPDDKVLQNGWSNYHVRILGSAPNVQIARDLARRAEFTSELSDSSMTNTVTKERNVKRRRAKPDFFVDPEAFHGSRKEKIRVITNDLPPFPKRRNQSSEVFEPVS